MNTPTFKDLYEFVLANKTDKSFLGFSDERIVQMLYEGIHDKTLFYSLNTDGTLKGMLLFGLSHKDKFIFILENLSMSIPTLREFARKSAIEFPGYRWEAMRHGKHRKFSTKFYNKLTQ